MLKPNLFQHKKHSFIIFYFPFTKPLYKQTMSKRPLESDDAPTSPKKLRTEDILTTDDTKELDDIKSQLDALFQTATEHHEEARLEAVDCAYDIEESLKEAELKLEELQALAQKWTAKCEKAESYLKSFEESPIAKMLRKVSESDVEGIDKLSEDYKKMSAVMDQLKSALDTNTRERVACSEELARQKENCERLRKDYETAEKRAEGITLLNEN